MPVTKKGGAATAWRAEGPLEDDAPGEPVLMIMGLAASSRMWYRLLPKVSREHRAIVFDNRGTGDSAGVRGPLSMAEMANDAMRVLDAAGEESAHVIGASMGGMIAQHVALDHPERVRSLVLACTTSGGRREPPNWRLLASTAFRPLLGPGRSFDVVAPALYSKTTLRERPERAREDLQKRIADNTSPLTTYAQMAAVSRHNTRDRLGELADIPTLVLHGKDDALVPPTHGQELAELIPGAKLELIPSCGHILGTDAEEKVAAAMLEHLERSVAVGSTP